MSSVGCRNNENIDLIEAAKEGNLKKIEDAIKKDVDVNTRNKYGSTALMEGAMNKIELKKL